MKENGEMDDLRPLYFPVPGFGRWRCGVLLQSEVKAMHRTSWRSGENSKNISFLGGSVRRFSISTLELPGGQC